MVPSSTDNRKATSRPAANVWEVKMELREVPRDELSPLARHTLVTLIDFADTDGSSCFPTYEGLAAAMGRGRSQVGEGLKELVDRGWITRESFVRNKQQRTRYGFLIPVSAVRAVSGPPDDTRPAHRTQPVHDTSTVKSNYEDRPSVPPGLTPQEFRELNGDEFPLNLVNSGSTMESDRPDKIIGAAALHVAKAVGVVFTRAQVLNAVFSLRGIGPAWKIAEAVTCCHARRPPAKRTSPNDLAFVVGRIRDMYSDTWGQPVSDKRGDEMEPGYYASHDEPTEVSA